MYTPTRTAFAVHVSRKDTHVCVQPQPKLLSPEQPPAPSAQEIRPKLSSLKMVEQEQGN
jgi:hypothetical protein